MGSRSSAMVARAPRVRARRRLARVLGTALVPLLAIATPLRAQGGAASSSGGGGGPDQQFLREMADLNRGIALLAHGAMHRPGASAAKTAAQRVDKAHDDEMDHLRAALTGLFHDSYSPRVSHADSATAAALATRSGAAYDRAFRADVAALDQRGIELIDRYAPQLTHPELRTLAERMRASAESEIASLRATGR